MSQIKIKNLTKDYGNGRGVFDINLEIEKGETFGFVGTNGAGKTTTIRHLMGFLQPAAGSTSIGGLDCWKDSAQIKKLVGYVPGEIAFPDARTGVAFLKQQGELNGRMDKAYCDSIIKALQLDPTANLKRMSKGMKQKTAITAAFMHNPDILILDEPTTGLDPLMRAAFIDILNEEKKKGKTIFMSSHMFDEVEDTCDKVALIKNGKIISVVATADIKHNKNKTFKLEFITAEDFQKFLTEKIGKISGNMEKQQVTIDIHDDQINLLTSILKGYHIKFFKEVKYSLEQYFNNIYKEEK
jgi:ABC-2 type transport system ATP-binding protein